MWSILIGGGFGAIGGLTALWALWSREKAKRALDAAKATLKETTRNLEHVAGELDLAYAEVAKHDETIRYLKGQIDGLETDLDKCTDPGDVRNRARVFLALAKAGKAAAPR